jgi:hypothetical protein
MTLNQGFAVFSQRAKVALGKVRPTSSMSHPLLSIEKATDAILFHWRTFIREFSLVIDRNIAPLYVCLANRMSDLIRLVQVLSHCYDRPHPILWTTDMRITKAFILSLEGQTVDLKKSLKASNLQEFDALEFRQKLNDLGENVRLLFPDVFPNNSVTLGSIIELKRDILITFEVAMCMCAGIKAFDGLVKGVTDAIFLMAEAFERLFVTLGVKRNLLERVEDDQPIEMVQIESAPTVAAVIENCSRIQSRLM